MYARSAEYYDALYHFKDYAKAANALRTWISRTVPHARTLLDVACGTGRHLEYLREGYEAEGLDLNPVLLATARERCPDVPFHQGDMTDFALGRTFDVVTCLFSAIAYVKTTDNLRRTLRCLAAHRAPGGAIFLEPFVAPENFRTGKLTFNVADLSEKKIAWAYVARREGTLGILDIHHLVGADSGVEYFMERHEVGLFAPEEYVSAFEDAGMNVEYDSAGLFGRGMYIGTDNS
jgi:SAM-dependent methyltransferase